MGGVPDRRSRAVVGDADTAVGGEGDLDTAGGAAEDLVQRPFGGLNHQVVKAAFTDRSDVHSGPLPNGFQTFQNHDGAGVVRRGFLAHNAPSEGVRQSSPTLGDSQERTRSEPVW